MKTRRMTTAFGLASALVLWGCGEDGSNNGNPDELRPNNTQGVMTNNGTGNSNGGTGNSNNGTGNSNNGTGNSNNSTGGSNNGTGNTNSGNQLEPDPNSVTLPNPADFDYSAEATFTLDGVLGGLDGAQQGTDPSIVCTSGCEDDLLVSGTTTLYPIDNAYGWDVVDFVGATEKGRDGVYDDGYAGEISDADGNVIGLAVANVPTKVFKTGDKLGGWCAGVHPEPVKCITENRVVMEHVRTCHETIPYMFYDYITGMPVSPDYSACPELDHVFDRPLTEITEYFYDIENQARTSDYAMRLGEHPGEWKMVWGDTDKRPTDMHVVTRIPIPAEFKTGGDFNITRAELAVVHTVTNNPNDKIRPEDIDNEDAAGRLPEYTMDGDGRWISAVDCFEGDGDFIPAGTVFKNPAFADPTWIGEDLQDAMTNAWFTSIDREPFEWDGEKGPRWRLKNPKLGQDLPGFEAGAVRCALPPYKRDEKKYYRGDVTVTHINLLDPEAGEILFGSSRSFIDHDPEDLAGPNLTDDGVTLTDDLDLVIYVKGDIQPVRLYKAVLYLDYQAR